MKKTIGASILLLMLSCTSLYAQDETLPGPAGCNAGAASGTWTVPCDVTAISVEVYGGGGGAGGGGGGSNGGVSSTYGGGGSGGGGYTTITIIVIPGSTFAYSLGSGGCGGGNGSDSSDGGPGSNGGTSSFSGIDAGGNPVNLTANGGVLGTEGEAGGLFSSGSTGSGGAGGTSSGGSTNTSGAPGSNGSGGNGGVGGAGAGPSGGAGGVSDGGVGTAFGGGGGGGDDSNGGNGAPGGILITYTNQGPPTVTPIVATTSETCSSDGTATISNYVTTETYVFTPAGPTVGAGGAISSMAYGTSYTVVAGAGSCASSPSTPFSIAAATGSVVDPIISTTAATCTADGSSIITTYNATATYAFTPTGPTVGAGGAISGMTVGTSYTVTESDQTCTSASSPSFSNGAQLPAPTITMSGTLSYCLGSSTTITASGGVTYLWDDPLSSTTPGITVTQGTYTVTGTDASGCTGTATAIVTETAPFTITFAGALNHCPGQSTDITASGGVSYLWGNGETTATVTLTQGTHTVTATDALGCMSTDDVIITQIPVPVADFVVIDACDGVAVQFTDATVIASGNLTDWDWDLGDNTQSTDQNPTHIYAQPGTYSVTLTASAGTCSDQVTLQATVFPDPVADFTTVDVCAGTAATFTDNSSVSGLTISQWAWDFDGQGNAVTQDANFTFVNAGTFSVSLGVITSDLCADTYTGQITVYPAPVPAFTAAAVCEGSATSFLNQSTVSSGSITGQIWDFGDALGSSTVTSPGYTYAMAGTYTVTLDATTGFGCTAQITQSVTVNPNPTIVASTTDVLCFGQTNGTATVSASGATAPYNYQWNDPLQATTATIQDIGPGQLTVTVTDDLGCSSDTTVVVIEPLPINVDPVAYDDTCGLGNGAVEAVMLGGTAPFEYVWSTINDSSSIYSLNVPPSGWNTMLNPGEYTVTVTDAGGCTAEATATVGQIASPVAAFTTRSHPEELTDPSVQFINGSQGAVSYEWHFGEGGIGYNEDPVYLYDQSGVYLVMLIAYNDPMFGCSDTTFGYVEVDPLFTFYIPNAFTPDDDGHNDTWGPVGDHFEYESYNVQVFDRWGSLLWQTDNPDHQWNGMDRKGLRPVKQGVYIYQFIIRRFDTFKPKVITGSVTVYRHN